jgi:hypothetical protein
MPCARCSEARAKRDQYPRSGRPGAEGGGSHGEAALELGDPDGAPEATDEVEGAALFAPGPRPLLAALPAVTGSGCVRGGACGDPETV